ncbi:DAK2 domain-containing protein [Paenibacillus larvae]|uniref:Dihydroxyacetone-like protein/glyceraldehyde kinase-like protein n=2 Tax=Paenibacillus larvae TaxID=1464 RepID=V9W8M9_9BACL|nr:DAK2 domain-containing protein [Paenibacillus larvae]AHD06055.1 dihydroxyacetone-like protein/glyceraldehyde kinase-like protein [Paenibacillus larvae subsp. larvae DSM 25430]AVG12585.1 dihydroxyacetone-like protein/glyceraldehyde kinase-like protein [Paenibacillus larvae subsp. larvae DSM 25430]MDR5569397.1 DAK2 domain-containing protein [Paenibacillus larvae]MDR5596316.1 DAK2 domain-containing protein [Paenibacillus larvae]
MGKRFISINGNDFIRMMLAGADNLQNNVDKINGLNVFPVPDGDTGTNMNLTLTSGVEELKKKPSEHIGKAAETLSKGLLMGARGNSGVILSQLFRGFAKYAHDYESINLQQFASALQEGVDTAYKAVVKPVEGTVLTVSKDAARHASSIARRYQSMDELMQEVLDKAKVSLAKTPDLLPVLKQVGVVDAGGQGLVCIYEGFLNALRGITVDPAQPVSTDTDTGLRGVTPSVAALDLAQQAHIPHEHTRAQSKLATEDIVYGYCTEFLLRVVPNKVEGKKFEENRFREELGAWGDSLLVVADDELVKVHIHAEHPGSVMNLAQEYGDLSRIKIENMRDQHTHILMEEAAELLDQEGQVIHMPQVSKMLKPYGFVAVAIGEGIKEIFTSVGVDVVLSGGQTMNPSTEDIVKAVRQIEAETVFILPNNSNIVLAAQQAKDLVEDKQIVVIPTKAIPQGLAAILAFQDSEDVKTNEEAMNEAIRKVRSGQVTYAVRDTTIDNIAIKKDHFIGIQDGKIVASEEGLIDSCKKLLDHMIQENDEILTILTGESASDEDTSQLEAFIQENYPHIEIELHPGGQPLYTYIFSVE